MDTKLSTNKTRAISLLAVVTLMCGSLLTTGFGITFQSAWLAGGATITVTSTDDVLADDGLCTLREAIIAANTNVPSGGMSGECRAGKPNGSDVITLANGATYSLTIDSTQEDNAADGDLDILDNKAGMDLFIKVAKGGTATISQDASVDDRVLHILGGAKVKIDGLTLTGGTADWSGGGIFNAGTLIVNYSTISGNVANYGGGIYNDTSGTLILAGSTVSGNTANVDGGGLENGGTLTVDASTFSANSATYGGGGLFTYLGTVTIQNGSVFGGDPNTGQGNTANYGGGIAVWSGNLSLTDSTISGNTVSWVGGAIRNGSDGTVIISTSTISNNSAEWDGGGILNEGAMTVDASEVLDNTATFQGGGIGNYEGDLTISASTVSGNSSGDGGGAVNWPNSTLTVDASTFTNNTAGSGGGLRNQGTATITNRSQFTGNTVGWMGGAITNDSGGVLLVEGASIISGNSSDGFAGGLYNDSASTLTVNNSTITGNVSVYGGGGIVNDGNLTVENSVLSGNTSGQGGGLYNPGTVTIINTTVGGSGDGEGNIGTDGGGGLFNVGTMTVTDSFVIGNDGTTYGGGLFNWIGGMLTISNSTVSGNSANEGGGLHNKEGSTAIIQNGSIFSGNYARFSVGGIQNWGTITITDSVLRENMSPGEDGDAIANTGPEGSNASINASCIVGNGDTAVFSNLVTLLNATGNWWGDASGPSGVGPGIGDSVSANIDFSAWLTEPPSICVSE